jgi:RHS repeat-associated protein
VRQTLSDAGSVLSSQNHGIYGQPEGGTQPTTFGYTGELQDGTSNAEYLRARWYQPGTGTLLGVDPMVDSTGQAYAYAGANPVNGSDPSGRCTVSVDGMQFSIPGMASLLCDQARSGSDALGASRGADTLVFGAHTTAASSTPALCANQLAHGRSIAVAGESHAVPDPSAYRQIVLEAQNSGASPDTMPPDQLTKLLGPPGCVTSIIVGFNDIGAGGGSDSGGSEKRVAGIVDPGASHVYILLSCGSAVLKWEAGPKGSYLWGHAPVPLTGQALLDEKYRTDGRYLRPFVDSQHDARWYFPKMLKFMYSVNNAHIAYGACGTDEGCGLNLLDRLRCLGDPLGRLRQTYAYNSNNYAYTLVDLLGLRFPAHLGSLNAPGWGQDIPGTSIR